MTENKGILYIATGSQFTQEAILSAQSVQSAMPNVPIAIISDEKIDNPVFDETIIVSDPSYDFNDQIKYILKSPFDRTILLDTDIFVENDISDLFVLLDEFDIAAAHNHDRSAYDVQGVPTSFPEYNTGVVVFKTQSKFSNFVSNWKQVYDNFQQKNNSQNQPAFRKALYHSDLRIATLRPEDNLMLRYAGHSVGKVRVFHGRLQHIDTPGSTVKVDNEQSRNLINSVEEHRVWIHKRSIFGRKIILSKSYKTIPKRLKDSVEQDGIYKTIRKSIYRVISNFPR